MFCRIRYFLVKGDFSDTLNEAITLCSNVWISEWNMLYFFVQTWFPLFQIYWRDGFHAYHETINNSLTKNPYSNVIGTNKRKSPTFDDPIEVLQHLIVILPNSVRRKKNCFFSKMYIYRFKMETKETLIIKKKRKKKQIRDFGKIWKTWNKNKL